MSFSRNVLNFENYFPFHKDSIFYKDFPYDKKSGSSTNNKVKKKDLAEKQVVRSDLSSGYENNIRAISARTVNKLATNGYHNSLQFLGLLRPLEVLTPVKITTTFLTTFNYVMGCAASMSIPESKNSTVTSDTDYDASSKGAQTTPDSQNTTMTSEPETAHDTGATETLTTEDSKQSTATSGITSLSHNSTATPGEFDCRDGSYNRFLEHSRVCDYIVDCKDGSDEKDCPPPCNPETEFFCAQDVFVTDDYCIPSSKKCDDKEDCKMDDFDELNCDLPEPSITTEEPIVNPCHEQRQFFCIEGSIEGKQCIHISHYCDGEKDCLNGSDEDEVSCTVYCENNDEFYCPGGECIDQSDVCDTHIDCVGADDEKDCPHPCKTEEEFHCALDSESIDVNQDQYSACININSLCNDVEDCPGGLDENNCTETVSVVPVYNETLSTVPIDTESISPIPVYNETVSTVPSDTETPSSLQSIWSSLTDYTTYLPSWTTDQQKEKENNNLSAACTLGAGIGIGAGVLLLGVGSITIWNAVKRRELATTKGEQLGWIDAVSGGLKDTACLKIRKTQQRNPIYKGSDNLEMGDINPLYDFTSIDSSEKKQTTNTIELTEASGNAGETSEGVKLLADCQEQATRLLSHHSEKHSFKYKKLP